MAKTRTKVKSYKKTNGKKVRAHIRKTTEDKRFKSIGKGIARKLDALTGKHGHKQMKSTSDRRFSKSLRRSLNKLNHQTRRGTVRKHG